MNIKSQKAFTLMELLIYIGIFAGISVAVVSVLYITSTVKPGIDAKTEVQSNMRLALEAINQKVAQSVSVKTAQSGLLELIMPTETASTTVFTLSGGVLYMKEGTAATTTLTSDKVNVDSLVFGQVFQPPAPRSISVAMTMSYKAGGNPLLEFSSTLQQLFPIAKAVTFDSGLFPNADNNLNIGASTLRWKNAYFSGSVGIGTAEPGVNLHIAGADGTNAGAMVDTFGTSISPGIIGRGARGTKASPSAVQANDNLVLFGGRGYGTTGYSGTRAAIEMRAAESWTDSAQGTYITFGTTATASTTRAERMRITAAGNVGIGTAAPDEKLQIFSANIADGNNNAIAGIYTNDTAAVNLGGSLNLGGRYDTGSSATLGFGRIAGRKENGTSGDWAGYLQLATREYGGSFAERMRITSTGNVGIGTTGPDVPLYIKKSVAANFMITLENLAANGVSGIRLNDESAAFVGYVGYDNGGDTVNLNSYGATPIILATQGGSIRLLGGNVGIGTTGPTGKLHVSGSSYPQIYVDDATSRTFALGVTASTFRISDITGTADRVTVDVSGNVGIGATAPGGKLEIASAAQNALRLKKTAGVAGSVDLFPAVGDGTSRTGTALCQTVVSTALCLGYWQSGGTQSACGTSIASGRALCADFGD